MSVEASAMAGSRFLRISLHALVATAILLGCIAVSRAPTEVTDGAGYVTTSANVAYAIVAGLVAAALLQLVPFAGGLVMGMRIFGLGLLALHAAGLLAGLYATFPWWDDVLHFSFGVAGAIFGVRVLQSTRFYGRVHEERAQLVLLAVLVVAALALLWEVFELTLGVVQGTRHQAGLVDTIQDVVVALVGSGIGAWWLAAHPSQAPRRASTPS